MEYVNVRLTFVAKGNAAIRISFYPRSGSWPYVGNEVDLINANETTMNMGWIDGAYVTITESEKGIILHEFGHTLGLMHEHLSPVRGGTILKESGTYACSILQIIVPTDTSSAVIEFYTRT